MRPRDFIETYYGRFVASCVLVWVTALTVTVIIFGGTRFIGEMFVVPWFPFVWNYGQVGVWQPLPLALLTLVILAAAARWKATALIATAWFVLITLWALLFFTGYDGKS